MSSSTYRVNGTTIIYGVLCDKCKKYLDTRKLKEVYKVIIGYTSWVFVCKNCFKSNEITEEEVIK